MGRKQTDVDVKGVCQALLIGHQKIKAGEKEVSLWLIYSHLTHENIRYFTIALNAAKEFGLVLESRKGYRLTEAGKRVAET